MKVLVSGGAGFIAGHLVKRLLDEGHQVRAVDKRPFAEWKQIHPDAENWQHADLLTMEACMDAVLDQERVYHLAAESGGMGYITTHRADCMMNVVMDGNMLAASRDAGVERFYFASSACVYPVSRQQSHVPAVIAEDWVWPADPEPGYGLSKLHTEQMCLFFAEDYGLNVRIGRHQSIFGERGWYDGGREKAPTAICRKVAKAKLRGEHHIEVWGDGSQARDFVYISDAIDAITGIMGSSYGQPVNLGTGTTTTVAELVDITAEIAGWEVERRQVPGPLGVQGRSADTTLVAAHVAWKSQVSVREGLERTYADVYDRVKAELG
jgi:nucleoside-diphosphate-sugar epimerase